VSLTAADITGILELSIEFPHRGGYVFVRAVREAVRFRATGKPWRFALPLAAVLTEAHATERGSWCDDVDDLATTLGRIWDNPARYGATPLQLPAGGEDDEDDASASDSASRTPDSPAGAAPRKWRGE
jgi:hypothetical protein